MAEQGQSANANEALFLFLFPPSLLHLGHTEKKVLKFYDTWDTKRFSSAVITQFLWPLKKVPQKRCRRAKKKNIQNGNKKKSNILFSLPLSLSLQIEINVAVAAKAAERSP